jgi:TATA-binding protein-associated factor Taf7
MLICFPAKPSKPVPGKRNDKNAPSAPSALPVPTRTTKSRNPSAPTPATQQVHHDDEDGTEDDLDIDQIAFSQPRDEAKSMYAYMEGLPRRTRVDDVNEDSDEDDDDDDEDDEFGGTLCLPPTVMPSLIYIRYRRSLLR